MNQRFENHLRSGNAGLFAFKPPDTTGGPRDFSSSIRFNLPVCASQKTYFLFIISLKLWYVFWLDAGTWYKFVLRLASVTEVLGFHLDWDR